MSKVTSKYQVSIPRALARQHGIKPGDKLTWEAAGDALQVRLERAKKQRNKLTVEQRLALFDKATERAKEDAKHVKPFPPGTKRDWTREDLYKEREDRMFKRMEDSLKETSEES